MGTLLSDPHDPHYPEDGIDRGRNMGVASPGSHTKPVAGPHLSARPPVPGGFHKVDTVAPIVKRGNQAQRGGVSLPKSPSKCTSFCNLCSDPGSWHY